MQISNLALLVIFMLSAAYGFATAVVYRHIKPQYRKLYEVSVSIIGLSALAVLLILAKP